MEQGLPVDDIPLHAAEIVQSIKSYEFAHQMMTGTRDFKFILHVVDGYIVSFLPSTAERVK
jgi:hypothetical protein